MHRYHPVDIIRKKRDGGVLSDDEINYFISSYLEGHVADYQVSVFLMAVYFNGLNEEETMSMTRAFINSGDSVDLSFIPKPKIDKHSTGGVGDKTSIILAPLLACFDIVVPMISGRGLGHTGGTLDKLESIPGFKVHLSVEEFKTVLERIGVSMIGQTDSLTPADKKIYALRDVTATVENISLITSSIVSKKIAEGADGIVYDVKVGYGSTLPSYEKSKELAQKLISITKDFGRKSTAILTDMHEPLGYSVGNWLEIEECISLMRFYSSKSTLSSDLCEVTLCLAGAMLLLGEKCTSIDEGTKLAEQKLQSDECFRKFQDLVKVQGGNIEFILDTGKFHLLHKDIITENVLAPDNGYISTLDAYKFGLASIKLGCGRIKAEDKIDYAAGIILNKKVGDGVNKGENICTLKARDRYRLDSAKKILQEAVHITETPVKKQSKILEVIN